MCLVACVNVLHETFLYALSFVIINKSESCPRLLWYYRRLDFFSRLSIHYIKFALAYSEMFQHCVLN